MPVVLDTSVFSAALIRSQLLGPAEALVKLYEGDIWGPPLLRLEFYNTLLRLERRRVLAATEVPILLERFESLDIELIDDERWAESALRVARRYNHAHVYDAIYLACAEDLDAELWTCDARFVRSFGSDRPARLKLCPDDVPTPVQETE